jgi:hypothetical protein
MKLESKKAKPYDIDLETAAALVHEGVSTMGGDFVYKAAAYDACRYLPVPGPSDRPNAATGCLIGTALALHPFVTEGLLAEMDNNIGSIVGLRSLGSSGSDAVRTLNRMISPEAMAYLQAVQSAQDSGASWRVAEEIADNMKDSGVLKPVR